MLYTVSALALFSLALAVPVRFGHNHDIAHLAANSKPSPTSTLNLEPIASAIPFLPILSSPTSSSSPSTPSSSDPNTAKVTNSTAFASGAGNKNNTNENDGGTGKDVYACYSGPASAYPPASKWVSFASMWEKNSPLMLQSCGNLGVSPETTQEQVGYIKNAIETVAAASLVDHRFILATVMQESKGCVNIGSTANGVLNPGLMQSHDGTSFIGSSASASSQAASIQQMIIDGTQGTNSGGGAVQGINMFGNIYEAARWYDSGSIDSKDLNNGITATASYVVDIANRLTGWVSAPKPSETCS